MKTLEKIIRLFPFWFPVAFMFLIFAANTNAQDTETVKLWTWNAAEQTMEETECPIQVDGAEWKSVASGQNYFYFELVSGNEVLCEGYSLFMPPALSGGIAIEQGYKGAAFQITKLAHIPFPSGAELHAAELENGRLGLFMELVKFFRFGNTTYLLIWDYDFQFWYITDGQGNLWKVPEDGVQRTGVMNSELYLPYNWQKEFEKKQ